MKLKLKQEYKSIKELNIVDLPDLTVITGLNGSGKTQLLRGINEGYIVPYDDENKINFNENPYYENGTISTQYINFKNSLYDSNSFSSTKDKNIYSNIIDSLNRVGDFSEIDNSNINNNSNNRIKLMEVKHVFEESNISSQDFNYNDFLILRNSILNKCQLFNMPNFSEIIVSYYERLKYNKFQKFLHDTEDSSIPYLTDEQFINKYGRDPVEIFNEYLKAMNDKFVIEKPTYREFGTTYQAKLINEKTREPINLSDLSTGETVFFQLLVTLFNNSKKSLQIPKIVLLDEMDAGLHPYLIKKLLNDIKKILIEEMKIKAIMTTHSPTTVALCEEENLYVMRDSMPRINKITKQKALDMLTIGIPTLKIDYNYRRQVLVESDYDAQNYGKIYEIFKDSKYIENELGLSFISSGSNKLEQSGSCELLKKFVKQFIEAGNNRVYGIIDYDNHNASDEKNHIYCLAEGNRYSIENCFLDPLVIGLLLITDGFAEKYKFPITKIIDIEKCPKEYQTIIDIIIDKLEIKKNNICQIKTVGGYKFSVPKEILNMPGHDLEKLFKDKIPELKRYKNTNSLIDRILFLFKSYDYLIPIELLNIIKLIMQ